eukprot:1204115-Pleurochrysis_carterae.AAC.1
MLPFPFPHLTPAVNLRHRQAPHQLPRHRRHLSLCLSHKIGEQHARTRRQHIRERHYPDLAADVAPRHAEPPLRDLVARRLISEHEQHVSRPHADLGREFRCKVRTDDHRLRGINIDHTAILPATDTF